jgi:hypothetical protein
VLVLEPLSAQLPQVPAAATAAPPPTRAKGRGAAKAASGVAP